MYLPDHFATPGDAMRDILRNVHEIFPKDNSRISDGPFCVVLQRGYFTLLPFGRDARHRHFYFVDWDAQNCFWIFHVGLDY